MDKEEMRRTDHKGDAWTTMVSREGDQGKEGTGWQRWEMNAAPPVEAA